MENVEERVQARKEEYLREMRMRRGETVHDEWEEEEHPRDDGGRFTFKGAGSGGSAKTGQPGPAVRENSASGQGSSRFGPGREQLIAAVGNLRGLLEGKKKVVATKTAPQRTAGGQKKSIEYSPNDIKIFTERYEEHAEEFKEAAALTGIPLKMLVAIAVMESGINPDAKSDKSGAKGIMQIVPRTLADIQKFSSYDLGYEIEIWMRGGDSSPYFGALYLAWIAQSFNINLEDPNTDEVARKLYTIYFIGPGDARKFRRLKPGESVAGALRPDSITGNPEFFRTNGKPATRQEVEDRIRAKINKNLAAADKILLGK